MNHRLLTRCRAPLASLSLSLAGLVSLAACNNQSTVIVPNRVLDRPQDVTLTCVHINEDGTLRPTSLNVCDQPSGGTPDCDETDVNQLVGYIANSERNEVAVFRRCDTTAAVVDLDVDAPGYQLVPVGQLPSEIEATAGGCRVVTANAGSCDMTLLNGPGLASIALGAPQPNAPSSLVSRLVPRRSDGQPLGARPGALLATPERLSAARIGGVTPTTSDDGEIIDGEETFADCADDKDESVWVTFPTCQLVAEIDLIGGQILQSRRAVRGGDGAFVLEDAGTSPECPVDCPIQFPEGAPATCSGEEDQPGCRPAADADGYFPNAIELVEQGDPTTDVGLPIEVLDYSALFVGGLGSDTLFELQFEREGNGAGEVGRWSDDALSLTLEDAQGIQRIRATPPMTLIDDDHQFLYAVAGDGTTHVVDRNFSDNALGNECDTQVDPTTSPPPFPDCNPIDPAAGGTALAPDRRAFASGPGIRVSGGAAITDWAFYSLDGDNEADGDDPATDEDSNPLAEDPGVVGVGTTSFGRVVISAFGQFQQGGQNLSVDPVGIMDISVPPHSLWPSEDPSQADETFTNPLPLVEDEEPDRALPGDEFSAQALAPTMRRIDLAYAVAPDDDTFTDERQARAESLGSPANADELGRFEDDALYENAAVRAVVRDYQSWAPVRWTLAWEGTVPGTRSATGRVECDTPGWENGTCVRGDESSSEAMRVIDDSAAFCDAGVLPGDKLVILGCTADDDCGLGQRCLQEPTAPSTATGICISEQAYEEEFEVLRQVCAPFIAESCGRPRREFLITRAFQTEVHLQSMDRQWESHIRAVDPLTGEIPDEDVELDELALVENIARYTCDLPAEPGVVNQPEDGTGCTTDEQCTELNGGDLDQLFVCEPDGFCRGPCPGGDPECRECAADVDCGHFGEGALCVDFQCQRPCESGQRDCVQTLLPGPRCFSEFIDYVVRTRNGFTVTGDPTPGFISDRVVIDPQTGECREDGSASSLLTSRLRLGPDEESLISDPRFQIPECPNPDEAAPSDPNPCRITRLRSEGEDTLFHQMEYEGEAVTAVRFSNPNMSLVIDLTDLVSLASNTDVIDGNGIVYTTRFPPSFRRFERARIPRNYSEAFSADAGYIPISQPAIVGNTVMVFPVRIINGPTGRAAFVVDAGGRGGPAGVRGQIIRILDIAAIGTTDGFVDTNFLVR